MYQKPKNLKELMVERMAKEREILELSKDVETSMWDKCVFFDPHIKGMIYSGYVLPTCIYRVLADWDFYFEAIAQIHLGKSEFIKNGLKVFFSQQNKKSGFIPRIIHPNRQWKDYPAEETEHCKPFLSQVVLLVSKWENNFSWIKEEHYASLKQYLNYWLTVKDTNKNGLSEWDSSFHSGMDTQFERAGDWHSCSSEGVDLNCYLYRELRAISKIAKKLGFDDDFRYFKKEAHKKKKIIQTRLWDDDEGFYYDRDKRTGKFIKVKSASAFTPLWAGVATAEQAEGLVREHLINEHEFWLEYPVATYAKTETGYSGVDPMRGSTWVLISYIVFHGLVNYGYEKIAKQLTERTYDLVKKDLNFYEWYNSETGEGCGQHSFWGFSVLGIFMYAEYLLGIDPTGL